MCLIQRAQASASIPGILEVMEVSDEALNEEDAHDPDWIDGSLFRLCPSSIGRFGSSSLW